MTRQRYDNHSTEFGLWLRAQSEIDSSLGYVTTNIDYVWKNYRTGEWMFIEEKRYMGKVSRNQREIFKNLNTLAKHDPLYKGYHMIQFERTGPDDGRIFIDRKEVTLHQLIDFLRFK